MLRAPYSSSIITAGYENLTSVPLPGMAANKPFWFLLSPNQNRTDVLKNPWKEN